MGKIFYSNCLFEAIKAKIKNWQNTEIKHIRSKDNLIHFIWIDKKNGYRYDFAQVETVKYWVQLLWFKGYVRKKLILLLTLAVVMCGCVSTNEDGSIKLDTANKNNPRIVIIDSCEYIRWSYGVTHKGNCKYCAERRMKEQEELIRRLNGE